jgi:hypothetical protein
VTSVLFLHQRELSAKPPPPPPPPRIPAEYLRLRLEVLPHAARPGWHRYDVAAQALLDPARDAIARLLVAAMGRAAHSGLTVGEVVDAAIGAERRLADGGVPRELRAGAIHRQTSAGRCLAPRLGTRIALQRTADGDWDLVEAERITIAPNQPAFVLLEVSEAARDALLRKAMAGIEVH